MKAYYYQSPGGNVGDDLNALLWERLLPDFEQLTAAHWLVGVGSTLDERLNAIEGSKIVMGTGLRPGARRLVLVGDVRFAAVRGKLSARELGLGPEVALCDPGFLVAHVWPGYLRRPRDDGRVAGRVGLVPHIYSERWSNIGAVAADAGLDVISPRLPVEQFLERLGNCSRVYCESLHAAIFADALRIPWARARISSHYYEGDGVAEFKWRDAFSIVDLPVESATRATLIPIRNRLVRVAQSFAEKRLVRDLVRRQDDAGLFRLSRTDRLQRRIDDLLEKVEQLRSPPAVADWLPAPRALPDVVEERDQVAALRVLAFPKHNGTPFLRKYAEVLEAEGATLDEFSFGRALRGRYDVFHIHWPDSHLLTGSWWRAVGKHARLALLMLYLRARGTRIVWMMHNLQAHEKDHWLSSWLFPRWFPQLCTHVIALTGNGLAAARARYPVLWRKHAAVIPHGHYRDEYPGDSCPELLSRTANRRRLGLAQDRFTLLFFGNIRRYKNVPLLIEAFRALPGRDVQLVIAGQPGVGIEAADIAALARSDERIRLHLEFVPESQVTVFLGAADLVVLPFDSVLNSGSVLLALSLNRPVLAPRLGALPEIQSAVSPRWLNLYDGPLTAELLAGARAALTGLSERDTPDLSAFDWTSIAAQTLDLYRLDGRVHPRVRGGQYEQTLEIR